MQNIADAISNQIENSEKGIAPENSDAFVDSFTVSEDFSESITLSEKIDLVTKKI